MKLVYGGLESEARDWRAFQRWLGRLDPTKDLDKKKRGRPTKKRTLDIIAAAADAIVQARTAKKREADYLPSVYKRFWPPPRFTHRQAYDRFRKFRDRGRNRKKIEEAVRARLTRLVLDDLHNM
jgi:hypothetical protein